MRCSRALGVVLAGVAWALLPSLAGAQPAEMRTVLDPGGRFAISFPADWEVRTQREAGSGSPAVAAAAPRQAGQFRINVNVVVETMPRPVSPTDVAEAGEPALRMIFHEFTIVQEGPVQIGGRPAYYRYFTWRTNTGVSLYQVQVYFASGTRAFIVTGSTLNDPERIRADVPVIARIIDTFRISTPSARSLPR